MSKTLKKAMAVPQPTGETAKKMKEHGIYVLQDMLTRMPNSTQAETHKALQEVIKSGAGEFFKNMKPRTVISLPKIYVLNPKDIFEVDGKKYVSIEVDPPRMVGQKWTSPSGKEYKAGQPFEGEVIALDLDSGLPVVISLPSIQDKILKPTGDINQTLQKANKEIELYNDRIRSLSDAVGAEKLGLQIVRAKDAIDRRINTLDKMIENDQKKLEQIEKYPLMAFESYAEDIKNQVQRGELSLKDAYDTILFLYSSIPEKLISDIESNKIKIPDEIKEGILAIARKEVELTEKKRKEEEELDLKKEENIKKKEIPEIHDTELDIFTEQNIPGSKANYKEVTLNKSVWSVITSLKNSIAGSQKDKMQLSMISNSIENMQKYLGTLKEGQRSKKFLTTPEGKPVLDALNNFLEETSLFIKRYAVDIIHNNKVNPKLMGISGTAGNSIVAVALTRMYNVVKETIKMYTEDKPQEQISPVPPVATSPEKQPQQQLTPVSFSKNKIQKISEYLWNSFENRFKLIRK